MSYFTSKRRELAKKIVSAGLALTTFAFVVVTPASAATTAETITLLLAQIQALQAQLVALQGSSGSTSATACTFTRSLTLGVRGDDVKCLQGYLTSTGHYTYSGGATGYFGNVTKTAVAAWQTANGVSAVGIFGPASRAKYTAVAGSVVTTPTTPTTTAPTTTAPAGTGLTVSAASDQPAAGLFGESFASRPFTKVNFTASADGDITVSGVTVERTGQANDSVFSGVILLDETGTRIGTSKTLNSNHQAAFSDPIVIKAGTTKAVTLAGDSDNNQDAYAGQVASLTLVAVNAGSATVNGTLPITGNGMTVNSTLAIGVLTLSLGARDPGTSPTKEVGLTGYTFASLKLTAGSSEDEIVKSIRWNQSGSAAVADLTNLKTCIDGGDCYNMVSDGGKYYTAMFGASGLKLAKGDTKDIYVKGDVVSGSGRTVDFDLYRYADLKVTGVVYGYDILPSSAEGGASATDQIASFQSSNPNFDSYRVTISNGTINVTKSNTVAAQNVAVNLASQPLGGFDVEIKGEAITVAAMNFDVSTVESAGTGGAIDSVDITSISLFDSKGNVVAGPVDGVAAGNNGIQFTDTVTFPIGTNTYTIKGKLGTDFLSNDQVLASTTPSTDWSTVKGQVTGNSITPAPASAVTLNTMTVKAAALTVNVSPTPSAQNFVVGVKGFLFANYIFDASASGEDIRSTLFKARFTGTSNTADELQNCQLFDGATSLTTGSNAVAPANSVATADDITFNFDTGLITPKGTVKTIGLKCDTKGNVDAEATAGTTTYSLGLASAAGSITSTGMTSGQSVTESITTGTGQAMTIQSGGSISVALDASSPALKWVQAGATDQTMAVLRVTSSYEDVRLDRIGLQIATSASSQDIMASNTPNDIVKASIWNGAKKVGEATFTSNDYATSTFTTQFGATEADYIVPKDQQILLTLKADVGTIGSILQASPGHLLILGYDGASGDDEASIGIKGIGQSSGTALYGASGDAIPNGSRIAKAIPTVERIALASTKFSNVTGQTLYRFKVSAPAGTNGIGLYKFTFLVSTSVSGYLQEFPDSESNIGGINGAGAGTSDFMVTNYQVYCYSDSGFSTPSCPNSGSTGGLINGSGVSDFSTIASSTNANNNDQQVSISFNPSNPGASTKEAIYLAGGETRYFVFKGDITGASSTPSITVKMQGDSQYLGITSPGDGVNLSGSTDTQAEQGVQGDNFTNGAYVFATTASRVDVAEDADNDLKDNDFIWSDNATNTSQSISTYDWFNGFLVPGLSNTDVGVAETLTLTN